MPDPDGLKAGTDPLRGRSADELVSLAGGSTEHELSGPDRGIERSALYAVTFLALVGGSMLLRGDAYWGTGPTVHSIMESVATVLAFIVGGLALVRYYSRKQATFLLIGCGFLGAAILDLNHVIGTTELVLDARVSQDPRIDPVAVYAWTWTAGRVFLSGFLLMSFLAWRQEVRGSREEGISEGPVYLTALFLTVANLLLFDYVPLRFIFFPSGFVTRPAELLPAAFFLFAFLGFYRKGSWRRDPFEHWLLVSLLIGVLAHGAFMAFSWQRYDALFDSAHVLKILSYAALLAGLMSSVYATFAREATVLDALTQSNEALAREVDFRAKTEQAVKESSERLQRFLDDANDLIQRVDEFGRFLYVNRSWKRTLGYADQDLERLSLFDVVHPDYRRALEVELNRVLAGGEPKRFNTEYVAADGRRVVLSGSTQAQIVNGEPVATQSILRDVTEQRLAERRLEESERNLEALVENTGDSIWSVDREHRLITLNSAFSLAIEARTGREPKAGMLPSQLFPSEDDAQWYRELYARTLAGERHVAVRTDHVDGQLRYFELYANPIQSLEGVIGAVFFGKDVTQRVRAEEALQMAKDEAEAANKAKSDFLANMSHELRTPLNSVIGFTNVLLKNKDGRLNEKDVGFLNRVLANGKHLLALINEVLDLAKVEAGRMELIIEEVDLAELCVETVQQLEGQAKAKDGNVTLLADVPDAVARVETDSAKLKQVIINLVGNALKFTHGGSVTVRLELAPDGRTPTAIAVQDTGIGIPEDRLEAIFEAFQQAEAGTSRKYGGTGLGLALSRSICLLMGYDLMVESELGQGSTFKIVMGERAGRPVKPQQEEEDEAPVTAGRPGVAGEPTPREEGATSLAGVTLVGADGNGHGAEPRPDAPHGGEKARDVAVAGPPAAVGGAADGDGKGPGAGEGADEPRGVGLTQPARGNFKVLVVDDEADSRVLIQHILEEFGCEVFTAKNGDEGLRLAHEHQPDLMTVDLIMPGMTGWEVLRRLKSHPKLRSIPVVVVSVVANEGRGKLLGAVDLIMKPFEREDLLRVIWRNLGRRLGGRVLLMVDDPDRRGQLADVVHTRGLEVADPAGSEFMVALAREAPDAVVMDLSMPGLHGVAELLQLRDDRALTGLPVLALTHPGLNEKERELVQELATIHTDPSAGPAELEKLLDVSFAAAEAEA